MKSSTDLKAGLVVGGRYRVERFIGEGSLGAVYGCTDIGERERPVALRLLRSSYTAQKNRASFRDHLSVLACLRHPNLVSIWDFGVLNGSGTLYLVGECVSGADLFTGTETQEVARICELLVSLANALQYLHTRGVLHGNLKPSNVLLARSSNLETLKVLDFGWVRRWDPERSETAAYTAPEVLSGKPATAKSDLYSLGVLGYQLLTRRLPFEDGDPGFLLQRHYNSRADMRPIERLSNGRGLAQVLSSLIHRDPERRPSSAEDLVRMFSAALGQDFSESGPGPECYFSAGRFVGRDKEMALFCDRAQKVMQTGRGWTVYQLGESGAGKTRIFKELKTWALLEGWAVIEASCYRSENRSYGPFSDLLEKAGLTPGELGLSRGHDGTAAFEISPESAVGQFRDQLTREIVRSLSQRRTVLLLDDFHWADEATTVVLDYLSSDIQVHPVLVCVNARLGEPPHLKRLIEQSLRQLRAESFTLEPLSRKAVGECIEVLTGVPELGHCDWIQKACGGNPFFVEEALKHLVDRGLLVRQQGKWILHEEDLEKLEVPPALGVVISERLSQLSAPALKITGWLAVMNRWIPKTFLEELGGLGVDDSRQAVEELIQRRLIECEIREQIDSVGFRHGLISEVVLQKLPARDKRKMHRRIAELLKEQGKLQEYVMHCIEGRCGGEGIQHALGAAAQFRAEFAHEKALRCHEYLLANRKSLSKDQQCEVAIQAAESLCNIGNPKRAVLVLNRELKRNRSVRGRTKAMLLTQLAFSYQHLGNFEMLERSAKHGLRLLQATGSDRDSGRSLLLNARSFCALMQANSKLGLKLAQQALCGLSNWQSNATAGHVYHSIAALNRVGCNLRAALTAARRSVAILEVCGTADRLCSSYSMLGVSLTVLGRFPSALNYHNLAVTLSANSRSPVLRAQSLANLAECLCRIGRIEEAIKITDQALKPVLESNNPTVAYAFEAIQAEVKLAANQYSSARDVIAVLKAKPEGDVPVFTRFRILYLSAKLNFTLGNFDSALDDVEQLFAKERATAPAYEHELAGVLKAVILFNKGHVESALKLLFSLEQQTVGKRWPYQTCLIKLHTSELLLSMGRIALASKRIKDAERLARAMKCLPLMAHSHYLAGRIVTRGDLGNDLRREQEAAKEYELSSQLGNNCRYFDVVWRSRLCLADYYEGISDTEASSRNALAGLESMRALEEQVPKDMLVKFRKALGRENAVVNLRKIEEKNSFPGPRPFILSDIHDDHLRALLRFSWSICQICALDGVAHCVSSFLIRVLGAEHGSLFLREEDTGTLLPVHQGNRQDSTPELGAFASRIAGEVDRSGLPFVSANAMSDGRLCDLGIRSPVGTVLCAPLRMSGKKFGVVYADHSSAAGILEESTINLFAAFCNLSALAIENAIAQYQLQLEKKELEYCVNRMRDPYREIVGESAPIQELKERIAVVAASPADVLISGESGTGKDLVARAIHRTSSRASGPFVGLDCGSLSDSLVDSQLFGHRKGAFTGALENRAGLVESAEGGILFLDEISNLPLKSQAMLLRVVEQREVLRVGETVPRKVNIRVIAASNRNLRHSIHKGLFRADLFYRLNAMEARVPALRERSQDIPLLTDWFLSRLAEQGSGTKKRFSLEAMDLLTNYRFPGNVRELKHIIEDAYYSSKSGVIQVKESHELKRIAEETRGSSRPEVGGKRLFEQIVAGKGTFEDLVKKPFRARRFGSNVIREVIESALSRTRGVYRDAFALLGIPPGSYAVTLQFLKRNGCYVEYENYRSAL